MTSYSRGSPVGWDRGDGGGGGGGKRVPLNKGAPLDKRVPLGGRVVF